MIPKILKKFVNILDTLLANFKIEPSLPLFSFNVVRGAGRHLLTSTASFSQKRSRELLSAWCCCQADGCLHLRTRVGAMCSWRLKASQISSGVEAPK